MVIEFLVLKNGFINELMVRAPRCRGGAERLDAGTMEGFRLVFDRYFCEKTSLIYSCPPDQVQKSDFFPNGLRVWRWSMRRPGM